MYRALRLLTFKRYRVVYWAGAQDEHRSDVRKSYRRNIMQAASGGAEAQAWLVLSSLAYSMGRRCLAGVWNIRE